MDQQSYQPAEKPGKICWAWVGSQSDFGPKDGLISGLINHRQRHRLLGFRDFRDPGRRATITHAG